MRRPEECAAVMENFPEVFVSQKDRSKLVSTYQKAMTDLVGSSISIICKKRPGERSQRV